MTDENPGTQLALIDAELNQEVALLRNAISQSSGSRLKLNPTGDFTLPDGTNLGNSIDVVLVDFATHHDYYDRQYNPNDPAPPACYARGKDIRALVPGDDSPEKQADACAKCPWDKFGSGVNGSSKACKNTRFAAVRIHNEDAGLDFADPNGDIYFLAVPPSSIANFDKAVGNITNLLGHPIKARLTINAKNVGTYAKMTFDDPLPNPHYALHATQRAAVQDQLLRAPDFAGYAERAAQQPARNAAARRPGARR